MRQCGDCQLCCKLLPVRAINKPGGVRCKHQKSGVGCTIHRALPVLSPMCRAWSCGWLFNDAGELGRPDHSHIVIDSMPDFVVVSDAAGRSINVPAVQVWIDPKYKEAHRDPVLRAYLSERGKRDGACAIIRYSPRDAFVLLPPALTGGQWVEDHTPPNPHTHSVSEIVRALGSKAR